MRCLRIPRRPAAALAALAAAVTITITAATVGAAQPASARTAAGPPPCSLKPPRDGKTKPTTVTTIGQAYSCIFDHYYAAATVDDQVLLAAAFAGLTQQLDRLGLDQPDATMPALTGNRDSDWARFAAVYQRIISALPVRNRQQVAEATMNAMIAALNNNHSMWNYPVPTPHSSHDNSYGLGILVYPGVILMAAAPGLAEPPLYVSGVFPGSPAARAGVRPGDVITVVDGGKPFTDGVISPGVLKLLSPLNTRHRPVRITLRWPLTGATRSITITPAGFNMPYSPGFSSKLLAGHIAYVKLNAFVPAVDNKLLAAISALAKKTKLRGVILDLRGNGGGTPAGVASLVGALEHGKPYGYACSGAGRCTALYPDSHTPLLHLPLAVLTSRSCSSGCDQFASAVKDLQLGTLIGTRTAGLVGAATAGAYFLNDGSFLQLATKSFLGPDHEIIDGIGVAADYYIPTTDNDVATGHDPDIAKALALLGR
jgi:carboxyl-terminal processing protease